MENLSENWLTEGLVDFEYKKYLLLGYLKKVKESFQRVELYPFLSDLVAHYRYVKFLHDRKAVIHDQFPKELLIDRLQHLELHHRKLVKDDTLMNEIESIIEYAIPKFKNFLDEGSGIHEFVESQCEITPIGLSALYTNEGYLFIAQPPLPETEIYRYHVTLFNGSFDSFRSIQTKLVSIESRSLTNTFEHIKLRLMRDFTDLPNPATYLVVSRLKFPVSATLMPVAKRLLVRQVSSTA